jgi:hypothetical protein
MPGETEAAKKARIENNARVLASQIPPRPSAIASCPICLSRDCEILPDPIAKCPECAFRHDAVHTPLHRIKACWYWCPGCNLVYSGSQDEFEAERSRREEYVPPPPGPKPIPLVGTPREKIRALRAYTAALAAGLVPPGANEIHEHAESERAWESTQLAGRTETPGA